MEYAYQKHDYKNRHVVNRRSHHRDYVWLESTRQSKKGVGRMDSKIKAIICTATGFLFLFSVWSGVSSHTLMDMQIEKEMSKIIAAEYVRMPIQTLGEIDI